MRQGLDRVSITILFEPFFFTDLVSKKSAFSENPFADVFRFPYQILYPLLPTARLQFLLPLEI